MAIGTKDWTPKNGSPPIKIVRFVKALLTDDVIVERIEGVPVKIFGVAKTIADCFRHRRTVGQPVALEGLQEALRQRKAYPCRNCPSRGTWRCLHCDPALSQRP